MSREEFDDKLWQALILLIPISEAVGCVKRVGVWVGGEVGGGDSRNSRWISWWFLANSWAYIDKLPFEKTGTPILYIISSPARSIGGSPPTPLPSTLVAFVYSKQKSNALTSWRRAGRKYGGWLRLHRLIYAGCNSDNICAKNGLISAKPSVWALPQPPPPPPPPLLSSLTLNFPPPPFPTLLLTHSIGKIPQCDHLYRWHHRASLNRIISAFQRIVGCESFPLSFPSSLPPSLPPSFSPSSPI